ncbi:unnamed protein product [Psylliodes chrysocephalus]|uniref:BACK domain-containing protein n=1 Tax=Psylliodes chrysocephalus TaxID=3402493 RepID=A0A9P0GE56_9CUCU|nr:unnamed protein product [Psylliodes chrysocephala]
MVLKVDSDSRGGSKLTLDSGVSSETDESEANLREAYKHLMSSTKASPLSIDKPIVALQLFSTAIKLHNMQLAEQCIENLNNLLDKTNVLLILRYISTCINESSNPNDIEPSAPPLVEDESKCKDEWVHHLIDDNLRNNCFSVIDRNAEYVLKQKEVLELDYCDILSITTRDTLEISSEILVYSAIMRWCIEECKRRTLETQKFNLKAVLRDLVYAPRYGLMTKKEFLCRTIDGVKGPDRSGILDEYETEKILEYIKKKGGSRLPYKGGEPRKFIYDNNNFQKSNKNSCCSKKSSCDKFIINFLTCWTAVFD